MKKVSEGKLIYYHKISFLIGGKAGVKKVDQRSLLIIDFEFTMPDGKYSPQNFFPEIIEASKRWMTKWLKRFQVISNRKNFRS